MDVQEQIEAYIADQPAQKRDDLRDLHRRILAIGPGCRLWFLDGRNSDGKVVSNPNIGYGQQSMIYAGGKTRDFYQIGLSANTTGISVYIMGVEDKAFLAQTYGKRLGKASVTGYCIKFRSLTDIDLDVLEEAIRFGLKTPQPQGSTESASSHRAKAALDRPPQGQKGRQAHAGVIAEKQPVLMSGKGGKPNSVGGDKLFQEGPE